MEKKLIKSKTTTDYYLTHSRRNNTTIRRRFKYTRTLLCKNFNPLDLLLSSNGSTLRLLPLTSFRLVPLFPPQPSLYLTTIDFLLTFLHSSEAFGFEEAMSLEEGDEDPALATTITIFSPKTLNQTIIKLI